jgi:hypothetical protein
MLIRAAGHESKDPLAYELDVALQNNRDSSLVEVDGILINLPILMWSGKSIIFTTVLHWSIKRTARILMVFDPLTPWVRHKDHNN